MRISRTVLIVWKLLRPLFMFSTFSHLFHTIYAPTILSILAILATLSILSIYTIQYPYYPFFPYYIISIHPSFPYYPYCPNSKTHGHALKSYFWVSFITVFGAFWMWFPLIFLWGTMFYLKKTLRFFKRINVCRTLHLSGILEFRWEIWLIICLITSKQPYKVWGTFGYNS